jgi:hypothetical protein
MKIDGHSHCGEITFEAEVDPTALTICRQFLRIDKPINLIA